MGLWGPQRYLPGLRLCSEHYEPDYDRTVLAPQREEAAEVVRLLQTFVEVMRAAHVRPPKFKLYENLSRLDKRGRAVRKWSTHTERGWQFGLGVGQAAFVLLDGTVLVPGFGGSPDSVRPIEDLQPSLTHARNVRQQISRYLDEHKVRWPENGPSLSRPGMSG